MTHDDETGFQGDSVAELSPRRSYLVEEIFEDVDDYVQHLRIAARITKPGVRKGDVDVCDLVPTDFGIEFEHVKVPHYRIYRFRGLIALILPGKELAARKKAVIRKRHLDAHVGVVGTYELCFLDNLAMRIKVIEDHGKKK